MKALALQNITRTWFGKTYTSKAELFEAGQNGFIQMEVEKGVFGNHYTFYHNSKKIARFYQDHTFGFCTQPYGIELQF